MKTLMPGLKIWGKKLQEIVTPTLCSLCRKRVQRTELLPICSRCNAYFELLYPIKSNQKLSKYIKIHHSLFPYKGKVKNLVYQAKIQQSPWIKPILNYYLKQYIQTIGDFTRNIQAIVPVPDHRAQQLRLGKQSCFVAEWLSEYLKIPILPALFKKQQTRKQTELRRSERISNPKNSFGLRTPFFDSLRSIILVDDVLTTGGTVHACAEELAKTGITNIDTFSIARG